VTFASLDHRRFLDPAPPSRVALDGALFARLGGPPTVDALVDALYDGFEADELLRPLFGRELTRERANQKRFFAEWLGGPARYGETAYAGLAHRHEHLGITRALAGRWLGHLRRALAATVAAEADRALVFARAQTVAFALADQASPTLPASPRPGDLHCGRQHPVHEATRLARRGELAPLRAWLAQHPEALHPATLAAMALHAAALAGHAAVVALLLDAGVDANRPYFLPVGSVGVAFERVIFVTPLGAARLKRRDAAQTVLVRAGARDDVFTAALLGDLGALARQLQAEPALAQAADPATDVVEVTPVHHAIAGGHVDALRALLAHATGPITAGTRALRGAAARSDAAMVGLLLERGASATEVGPGRWVLHPELASLLSGAGASAADPEARWIGASCTGNQGRKDDPAYVRALLRHGASVDDRHAGATALHHAARAGFVGTIQVLLEHGADRAARDAQGRTPLDWVERAARTVDRAAARRALGGGARG
jgi:truncated hemoglobin YjbI/ankyrin repeat protein